MTTIGLDFKGSRTDKNGNTYFIIQPVKDLLPITIDKDKLLSFKINHSPQTEKSPRGYLDMFVPEKKEGEETKTETPKINYE